MNVTKCIMCDGTGLKQIEEFERCNMCKGSGFYELRESKLIATLWGKIYQYSGNIVRLQETIRHLNSKNPYVKPQTTVCDKTTITDRDILFAVLEISPTTSPKEIKKAYLKKSKKHHPDKKRGNQELMKVINVVYNKLTND